MGGPRCEPDFGPFGAECNLNVDARGRPACPENILVVHVQDGMPALSAGSVVMLLRETRPVKRGTRLGLFGASCCPAPSPGPQRALFPKQVIKA